MTTLFLTPTLPATFYYSQAVQSIDITRVIQLQASVPAPTTPQSFSLYQGDSVTLEVTVTANGQPLNLTGMTVKWVMQMYTYSHLATLSKSTSDGIVVTDATNGVFEVMIASSDTEKLASSMYVHQAILTDAYEDQEIIMFGNVDVEELFPSL